MNIKTNYFLRNMIDLDKFSIADYLMDAEFNYVIIENNVPIVWASDNSPVVLGGEEDTYVELEAIGGLDDKGNINSHFRIMTELEFIMDFCLDAITEFLYNKVVLLNEFDGTNYLQYFDKSFNGVCDINGMTDVLTIYSDTENKNISFLVSDTDDKHQDFCYLGDFDNDLIVKIVKYIENTKPYDLHSYAQ